MSVFIVLFLLMLIEVVVWWNVGVILFIDVMVILMVMLVDNWGVFLFIVCIINF